MRSGFLFWNGKLHNLHWGQFHEYNLHGYVVDLEVPIENHKNPMSRYGTFTDGSWRDCEYADLPAQFKAHLLLMGIQ